MNDFQVFINELQYRVDDLAQYCSSYVRLNDEAPPEYLSQKLEILRGLHDNWQYIVNKDTSYPTRFVNEVKPTGVLEDFVSFYHNIFVPCYGKNIVRTLVNGLDLPVGLKPSGRIKTIVYGGAFNPPTIAHLQVLNECVNIAEDNDEVWLLLSGQRRDKKFNISIDSRLTLANALIEGSANPNAVYLNTTELYRNSMVETIDTMKEFEEKYPERDFYWVFGVDSLNSLNSWHGGDWIARNANILIIPRTGYDLQVGLSNSEWLNVKPMEVSSTVVREKYLNNKPISQLVPDTVLATLHMFEDFGENLYHS